MSRPRLLDLFSGAGGAAVGYHRAGFEVVGVDHRPMPRYPFEFIQADALEFCREHGGEFDAIHASPPCQAYSVLRHCYAAGELPDLLAPMRDALEATGRPWVIENVVGAPLRHYIQLCGAAFGLRTYRHRRFESSEMMMQPPHTRHTVRVNRRKQRRKEHWDAGGFVTVVGDIGRYAGPEAMGIDWMTGNELSQAIPPAYTEYIGSRLREALP